MITVIAPEPAFWLKPLVESLPISARVHVIAPWFVRSRSPGKGTSRWRGALARRELSFSRDGVTVSAWPGWHSLEAACRLWAGSKTDRRFRAQFALRALVDRVVAARLDGSTETVIAPSLACRKTFVLARERGARTVLVEDLPGLAQLHADLDSAAARYPRAAFLTRFRAGPS